LSLRLATLALVLLLAGCGGGDDDGAASSPTATATQAAAGGGALDEDALLAVHDELYECLRKADFGVLASYSHGEASVAESVDQPEYDRGLAAAKEESRLLDGGDASYIGIRANTRRARERGSPDWDLLIFPSEDAATQALPALEEEAGAAEADGVFVRVEKKAGRGATAKRAETALTDCEQQAQPQA
jgi:hypothetical protein